MKKVLIIITIIALLLFPTTMFFAMGEEPIVTEEPVIEQTVEVDETEIIDGLTKKFVAWLSIGGGGTILITVIAIIKPYLKTLGENKTLKVAYTSNKDKIAEVTKENTSLKEFVDSINIKAIMGDIAKSVTGAVITEVKEILITEFNKKTDMSGQILANTEVLSALVKQVINAASVVWNGVDGVPKILASSVNTAVMEKALKENQAMKTIVAEKLQMTTSELQAEIDKAVL